MLTDSTLDALAERLAAADYTLDPVMERLGETGRLGLERNSTPPARAALDVSTPGARSREIPGTGPRWAFDPALDQPSDQTVVGEGDGDPQGTLVRLWILQDPVPEAHAREALGDLLDPLVDAGLLARTSGSVRAEVALRPYGAEASASLPGFDGWICHDLLPSLDGVQGAIRSDFVLGVSPASTQLAQMSIRRQVGSALDLGTGCGVQSLHLAQHAERVVATDLNPRALELARITMRLSGVDADLRLGSLYEPVADQTFDQIVSNPPYVMAPPSAQRLTYREGVFAGDELVRRVVADGAARLKPGGTMQVLANWAVLGEQPWQERLAGWLEPTGCDAFVVQREALDPFEYIEVWLADAGLRGTPEYDARYRAWLEYFEALHITGVGMGWLSLRSAGRERPDLRFEEWPYTVHQPVGDALAAQQHALAHAGASDAELLGARWVVRPGVVQETMGRPGDEDPQHLVLRQSYGLGRALEADTATAALVGACDGDLTAGQIIDALASILDADPAALRAEQVARLRELIRDDYLTRA